MRLTGQTRPGATLLNRDNVIVSLRSDGIAHKTKYQGLFSNDRELHRNCNIIAFNNLIVSGSQQGISFSNGVRCYAKSNMVVLMTCRSRALSGPGTASRSTTTTASPGRAA